MESQQGCKCKNHEMIVRAMRGRVLGNIGQPERSSAIASGSQCRVALAMNLGCTAAALLGAADAPSCRAAPWKVNRHVGWGQSLTDRGSPARTRHGTGSGARGVLVR